VRLFEPIRVGAITLPNRIVLPAMVTRLSGEDGRVNQDILDRYVRFARGGVGLIVVEAMAVHGAKSGPLLRISSDEFIPGLAQLARAVHDAGSCKVVPQIIHFLKISRTGWRQRVQDLALVDIDAIVDGYAAAAARARQAGFDGVELHMAHAYTLSSFLSRMNNRRDDYGGSLDNRLRAPTRALRAVRERVGRDFTVGVRFDGEECIKDGYSAPDAALIAERLARAGADYVSISAGGKFEDAKHVPGVPLYPYTGYSGDRCMPGATYPDGLNVYLSAHIRQHLSACGLIVPVVATGKIPTGAFAESIVTSGQADLIGLARALLADPDWPRKVKAGREDTLIRCQYGNVCKALDENFEKVVCTLWPKGDLQAPSPAPDEVAPTWPEGGARLLAGATRGRVKLTWERAFDVEGVYGYEVFRAVAGGPLRHLMTVRGRTPNYRDDDVLGGTTYRYQVRAYDWAGNRSEPSELVTVTVPAAW
jgi:2,4-dienoyl-CoA reductase-like NADH-dependent reductase (Old Yellow Enzyme family)